MTLEEQMRRIEAYCSRIERLAFTFPAADPRMAEIMSAATSVRSIALDVAAGRFVNVSEVGEREDADGVWRGPFELPAPSPK